MRTLVYTRDGRQVNCRKLRRFSNPEDCVRWRRRHVGSCLETVCLLRAWLSSTSLTVFYELDCFLRVWLSSTSLTVFKLRAPTDSRARTWRLWRMASHRRRSRARSWRQATDGFAYPGSFVTFAAIRLRACAVFRLHLNIADGSRNRRKTSESWLTVVVIAGVISLEMTYCCCYVNTLLSRNNEC